ncbi:hypothetical protein E3T47_04040 [Cryobacterium ruanii]|uniref:Uncharacterized protein n=1 Tax=Cryobacterium ruanii TaxID=1259197 RepID=A0A4R9AQK0_9MICO|nr:hypothetical protein E3T47_04040 [Cryobacterium ruanii]
MRCASCRRFVLLERGFRSTMCARCRACGWMP